MRILMLNYSHLQPTPHAPEIGGAARQCLKLSKALIQQGIDVTILTTNLSWQVSIQGVIDGVPVIYLNTWRPLFERKGLRRFGIYLFMLATWSYLVRHSHDYDVIHAHSALSPGFVAVAAARWTKKKSIIKVMNSGFRNDVARFREDKSIIGAQHMARYLLHTDCVIALNPQAVDELAALGFRPEQIELIPNGVEITETRTKISYNSSDTTRIIFVGRLHQAKGIDTLLNAFKILWTQMTTNYQLTILGKGPMEQTFQSMVDTLGMAPHVNFAGEVSNVSDYLLASDIFVLPSRAEGISNALLEAMATGLPCIATNVAGNQTVIQNEQNGLLVEPDNEVALADAIDRLARNCELRRQLGRVARQTVEKRFGITAVARQYINLYQKLLESSP